MKWRGSHRVTLSGMPRSFIDRGLDPIGEAPGWSVKRERRGVKMLVAAGADAMGASAKVDIGAGMIQRQGCCASW